MNLVRLPFAIAAFALFAATADAASIEGDWLTPKGGAKVHIAPCGPKLCGTVVWLKTAFDKTGQPQKDANNPDPALRSRPVIGMQFLRGFEPAGSGHWNKGSIYDPGGGKTYDSKLGLKTDGTLKVEGCIAVFCVAQIWTPAR